MARRRDRDSGQSPHNRKPVKTTMRQLKHRRDRRTVQRLLTNNVRRWRKEEPK